MEARCGIATIVGGMVTVWSTSLETDSMISMLSLLTQNDATRAANGRLPN